MKKRFSNKSSIIKLSAILLPIALIAAFVTGLTTSAMVSLEPVIDEVKLELLGQSENAEQSVYVIQETGNGFRYGEKLTWTDSETLNRVSVNGQTMNPWVTLPDETGAIQSVYQDRTNIYGRDLIVATTSGNIWRIDGAGNTQLVTMMSGYPQGIVTIPDNPAKYGQWAGKILTGDINGVHYIDGDGTTGFTSLGITPVDLAVITAGEDFYGITSTDGSLWYAPGEAFAGMLGDLLVAEQYTGVLWRVYRDGATYVKAAIAQGADWQRIMFFQAEEKSDRAVVKRGTMLTNARIEGSLWQLTGETTQISNGTITSDLMLPGTPQLQISQNAHITGTTITGTGSSQPSGYSVGINSGASLHNLITRVDAITLSPVAAPQQPSGTRNVSISNGSQGIGDPATMKNLTVSGNSGTISVPPGNYGAFSFSGTGIIVFGNIGDAEPAVYNLQSLSMTGQTRIEIAGPVNLTIGGNIGLYGSVALGSATDPGLLQIRTSGSNVQLSENAAIYGKVYAPSALVTISGNGLLDGMLVSDRLNISGGVVRISVPNAAPVVYAGEDQTIGWPNEEAVLHGTVTDDGFPFGILSHIWSKADGPGEVVFADAEEAETTAWFSEPGVYVLRLTATDGELTSWAEVAITVGTEINPIVVNAGANQTITLGHTAALNGTATGGSGVLSVTWSKISGPGEVTFGNSGNLSTTAGFSAPGTYVLRLTATDGAVSAHDEITITVTMPPPVNQAPVVSAGEDQIITLPSEAILNGEATDDGLPSNILIVTWSKTSGPGEVTFDNPSQAITTASFSEAGTYVLRLTAYDGALTSWDEVTITVIPATTRPPVVSAGENQLITLPSTAQLNGTVTYDGAVPTTIWSKISGPGEVIFGNPNNLNTTASFGAYGIYVLKLSATAGQFTADDTVIITVNPEGLPDLPQDPASIAPPLDPTIATTLADSTRFLYKGSNPVQRGMNEETIDVAHVAVVKGYVLDREGKALPGVTVTIWKRPEFGYTLSRADGGYDMAVNGGGSLVINYEKPGYLPVHRRTDTPWQDFVLLPEVRMIGLDPIVTEIDLNETNVIQVAQSSVERDKDGERQATMLFTPGTTATIKLPDGTEQALTTLHVRATEYTVDPNGHEMMPEVLPPQSGYTYAAEFSVDEAISAGALTVEFSQPVVTYVDNFLNFPVGTPVPVGYYDRQRGVWVAEDSGIVIKVLSISNGMANVDTTGNGIADNEGITEAERRRLADLYVAGTSLWRVKINHFTPYDLNWPIETIYPDEVKDPDDAKLLTNAPDSNDCLIPGSIIGCLNQTLGESIGITGTPFTLNYSSDRMPGNLAETKMGIMTGRNDIPTGLEEIRVTASVAGRVFKWNMEPLANQQIPFEWDGKDAYGRPLYGRQPISVNINYVYPAGYTLTKRFGTADGDVFVTETARTSIIRSRTLKNTVMASEELFFNQVQKLGGWTMGVHHAYDPGSKALYKGDGEIVLADALPGVIQSVLNGETELIEPGANIRLETFTISGLAVADDGSIYIGDWTNYIWHMGNDRVIRVFAGNGEGCESSWSETPEDCGDGIPATQMKIRYPDHILIGVEGIYFLDWRTGRYDALMYIDKNGIVHEMATFGIDCDYSVSECGDGGPAKLAQFGYVNSIALGPEGNIYIADSRNNRVRRISTDGLVSTIAGNGEYGRSGDGGPATQASFENIGELAVAPDGSIYIADMAAWGQVGNHAIRRITNSGRIYTEHEIPNCVTPGWAYDCEKPDTGPVDQVEFFDIRQLFVNHDGIIVLTDTPGRKMRNIRKITPDGYVHAIALGGIEEGDNYPATQLKEIADYMAIGPNGDYYFASEYRSPSEGWMYDRIRKIGTSLPGVGTDEMTVSSGGELYIFDHTGRHLRTLNALTRTLVYEFGYTPDGILLTITDGDGNVTVIERTLDGTPVAIISPYGQRTTLGINSDGYISSISDPEDRAITMTYHPGGLLATFADPNGNESRMTYDELGKLIKDEDAAGGYKQLTKTDNGDTKVVTLQTAMGRKTVMSVSDRYENASLRKVVAPDGTVTTTEYRNDETTIVKYADGTETTVTNGPDIRYGMLSPIPTRTEIKLPSGKTATTTVKQEALFANPADISSIQRQTYTITENSRISTSVYDFGTLTFTNTSPEGRQSFSTINTQGRITSSRIPGIEPVYYNYDSRGRLQSVTQGTGANQRQSVINYGTDGFVSNTQDALNRSVQFDNDLSGRIVSQSLPGNRFISFDYDATGNVTGITPPQKPEHTFSYTPVNLTSNYEPPSVAGINNPATAYQYNLDKQLTLATRPDGQTIAYNYGQTSGRLESITTTTGQYAYGYDGAGRINLITAPGNETLSFRYDGPLQLEEKWQGLINGQVNWQYDNNFRPTIQSINDDEYVYYDYDNDGLLTAAGDLSLDRDAQNGLLTGTTLGSVTDSRIYNSFGETTEYTAEINGVPVFDVEYTRDKLGRITDKTETVGNITTAYHYEYDEAGRLTDVEENSIAVSHYEYDENGNRTAAQAFGMNYAGTYDDQDRLLTYGATAYTYTPNGELLTKTNISGTTNYSYDVFGNLRTATLPGGTEIEYVIDGQDRRIGKKVNGTLEQGFLYDGQIQIVAELDGAGNIVSRFIYGDRANVPVYMQKGGETYRIIADHLGSPRLVINSTDGSVVQRMDYDEYGNVLNDTNPGFQPFGFAGGLYDGDTGLTRFGARDYDPHTGRWTAKDPIRFDAGDTNLYGYVVNDPINKIDPLGLWQLFFQSQTEGVGGVGLTGSAGFFFDFNNWLQSGFFAEGGMAGGASFGASIGAGFALRDIAGCAVNFDVNIGKLSITVFADSEGFNGIAVGGGPGLGMSSSITNTITYRLQDGWNKLLQGVGSLERGIRSIYGYPVK